ncbi:MAG: acetate--CoA ligase [Minisyncoccales bacterium]
MKKKGNYYFPTLDFQKEANLNDEKIYQLAEKDPVSFWTNLAEKIYWQKKWDKAFSHRPPYFSWFEGGRINITENIFEKNILGWGKIKNKIAIIAEAQDENKESVFITFENLFRLVNQFSNALKSLGVKKGDRVAIYLPMIPEALISLLACARIGAVHSVIFSAFSSQALKIRLNLLKPKVLITANNYFYRDEIVNLKEKADRAVEGLNLKMIVVKKTNNEVSWNKERDIWWSELLKKQKDYCLPESMESEEPLFILFTSGTTGVPKGCVHVCAGYTLQALFTGKWIFDFKENDILWCTSDLGWITGHTYTCYSPLLNGISTLLFEGVPDYPTPDRWARVIEKHKVSIFYTAPTALRLFQKYSSSLIDQYSFKSLRILGSVGEPIDEFSWHWYFEKVGKGRCPLVDTWWQTETGGILISSLPGIGPFLPTFAGRPLPGIKVEIFDDQGKIVAPDQSGNLVILPPFPPGMFRAIYQNDQKYRETYWSQYGNEVYFTSDKAMKNEQGLIRILGRVDDVIKVAGHRISTGELENIINKEEIIVECAVVGQFDEIKGEVPVVFVVVNDEKIDNQELKKIVLKRVNNEIGPIALPKEVFKISDLPKTRSGKIMRRILKNLLKNEELGDTSVLSNPEVIEKIKEEIKGRKSFFEKK